MPVQDEFALCLILSPNRIGTKADFQRQHLFRRARRLTFESRESAVRARPVALSFRSHS